MGRVSNVPNARLVKVDDSTHGKPADKPGNDVPISAGEVLVAGLEPVGAVIVIHRGVGVLGCDRR